MEGYNGRITNASNRNFASFHGNRYSPVSEERSSPMSQEHQGAAGIGCFSSRTQPSISRYDKQSQGSPVLMNVRNSAQNTFFRPEPGCTPAFSNDGISLTSDFSSESAAAGSTTDEENMNPTPEYDNWSMSSRSEFNGQNMYVGPDAWNNNINPNSDFANRGTFPKTDFDNAGGMLNRTQISGAFSKPLMSSGPRPPMSGCSIPPMSGCPMPPMNGSPRPPMSGSPRPPMSGCPMPPMNGRPRPLMNSGHRPPMSGSPRLPMNGSPMPPMNGSPMPPMNGSPRPPMSGCPMPPTSSGLRPPMTSGPRPPMTSGPRPPMSDVPRYSMGGAPRPPMSSFPRAPMNGVIRTPMNGVTRPPLNGVTRPLLNRPPLNGVTRPLLNRPPLNGVTRPLLNSPLLNGVTRLPVDGIGNSQMNGITRPPMDGIGSPEMKVDTRPPVNSVNRPLMNGIGRPTINAIGRPPVNNDGSRFFRPQMNSANTFHRPPVNNSVFCMPQFNGNPPPRMPPAPQRQLCNDGTIQNFPWDQGTNSFTRPEKFIRPGESQKNKRFAVLPQSKPAFKPQSKKLGKNDVFSSDLRDEGSRMKPWMTDELYAEVKKKNEMYANAKAANSDEMWHQFKVQRNKVFSLIKEAKLKNGFAIRKKKEKEKVDDSTAKPFSCDTCDRAFAVESKLKEHLKEHTKCEIEGCQFEAHPKIVALHKRMQHDTGYAAMISKLGDATEIEKWRQQRKSHFPTSENVKKRRAEQAEKIARGEVLETKDFGKFKKQKLGGQDDVCNSQTSANWKSRRGRRRRSRRHKRRNGFSAEEAKAMELLLCDSEADSDDESHILLHGFPGTLAIVKINSADTQDSFTSDAEGSQKSDFKHTDVIKSGTLHCTSIQDFSQKVHSRDSLYTTVPDPQTLSCETAVCELTEELTTSKSQSHYQANDFSSKSGHLSCIMSGQEVNDMKSVGGDEDDDDGPAAECVVKEIEATCCVIDLSDSPEGVKSVVVVDDDDDDGPSVEPVVKEVETTCCTMDFKEASLGDDKKAPPKSTKNAVQLKSRTKKREKNFSTEQSKKLNGESTQVKNNSFLEKLLADDIRHERNIILQCIRYTVNNNFFGVAGQRSSKS